MAQFHIFTCLAVTSLHRQVLTVTYLMVEGGDCNLGTAFGDGAKITVVVAGRAPTAGSTAASTAPFAKGAHGAELPRQSLSPKSLM